MTDENIARPDAAHNPQKIDLPNGDALLTTVGLCELFGVSRWEVNRYFKPRLHPVPIGARVLFLRSEVVSVFGDPGKFK